MEYVNINSTIQELSKILEADFFGRISIELILDKDIPALNINRLQFQQAIHNLCNNSRDAMIHSSLPVLRKPVLKIRTSLIDKANVDNKKQVKDCAHYVCIEVSDNGIGMDELTKKRIIDPYSITDKQDRSKGVGLTVVQIVVNRYNGFIETSSRQNEGTTIKLYFPIVCHNVDSETSRNVENILEQDNKLTILYASDNFDVAITMKAFFESNGFKVLYARDGVEAIQIYNKNTNKIHVVFLDLEYSGLDGIKTFSTLKDLNTLQKVVLAKSYIDPEEREELFRIGLNAFIQKYCSPKEILQVIHKVINNSGDNRIFETVSSCA